MNFFENGKLYVGCNYWASHAGMMMWRNWNESVVDKDFDQLSSIGIRLIRVFPLWSDFQPLEKIYGYQGLTEGYSTNGGQTLLDSFDPAVDETMMLRFEKLIDIADKYDIKLIPSLITGWMSGRLFAPPALLDKNLITDPFAIKWEIRFIKTFVKRFRNRKAIAAWCLGNECNCMSDVETEEQAWLWQSALSDAFRSIDPDRAVISGMHSQFTTGEEKWTLQDCGDTCDVITTHPYASPSYKTDKELMNTIKPLIHPAAQTIYSASIAQKPCFIEETGTFGQMYGNQDFNAKYVEGALYTAWTHNCLAYLWWIGYDQGSLSYHPFGYNNRASNYGLFREDRSIKPVGKVVQEYIKFANAFGELPERIIDAVCIVTPGQNTWESAGASFILAKQARLDMTFAYSRDKLPDAKAYFIPSLNSSNAFGSDYINELMQKVADGAVLYLSLGHGFPRNLTDDFGFSIRTRKSCCSPDTLIIGDSELTLQGSVIYDVEKTTAECVAKNKDGQEVFLKSKYGRGTVFVLMYPAETYLYNKMDSFSNNPYYLIYDEIAKKIETTKVVSCENRMIGITEHPLNDAERIIVATNYGADADISFILNKGWKLKNTYLGCVNDLLETEIKNCKTVVFSITK